MSQPTQPPQVPQRIQIELGEAEAEGLYANLTMISQSGSEFVIDFARVMPGRPKAKVYARVVMAPPNVKALLRGLEQNLKRFEDLHGAIGEPGSKTNIGFQSGMGGE
ncbi:MAG: DUF3467 domain-containing protein [Candidatus Krumholzibacteriota bacterium]|nr:DUF3467 domain-containing protein [Candidatus Krumholzibacteriota bacterium]